MCPTGIPHSFDCVLCMCVCVCVCYVCVCVYVCDVCVCVYAYVCVYARVNTRENMHFYMCYV